MNHMLNLFRIHMLVSVDGLDPGPLQVIHGRDYLYSVNNGFNVSEK